MKGPTMKTIPMALAILLLSASAWGQEKAGPPTEIEDPAAKRLLLGKHLLRLQWIESKQSGKATVTESAGQLALDGEQRRGSDSVTVKGTITKVTQKTFEFEGTIVTTVSHIYGGKPCTRTGKMTFAITGKRRYWRLQQMDNPCEKVSDYVDVFLR